MKSMGGHRDRTGNSQGSWFSSGYYGHFRSKHRNDFINQYRQQSKPSPPQDFHDKISDRPTHHHFSHHDNRFSFLNTVTSFEGSLGKRKVESNNKSKFIPDFIAWVPHKKEIESAGPKVSIYRDTFHNGQSEHAPQILVPSVRRPHPPGPPSRPLIKTPYLDQSAMREEVEPMATTYQLNHRHSQPNRRIITDMNTGTIVNDEPIPDQKQMGYINPKVASIYEKPVPSMTRLRRARIASAPVFRSSVADCMVWHNAGGEEQVRALPGHRERPKTVIGLLPELSNNDYHSSSHQQEVAHHQPAFSEPSHSTRLGVKPSATATSTVPMDSMQMSSTHPLGQSASLSQPPTQPDVQRVMLSESV